MSIVRVARRVGTGCVLLAIALWSLSVPLGCAGRAALVGSFALLDGAVLGLLLAAVTRIHRPILIYLFLGLATLTLWPIIEMWPLYHGWPVGDPGRIVAWPGAPELVYSYFDILRGALYLLGMPAPFARYGQHQPDLLSPRGPSFLLSLSASERGQGGEVIAGEDEGQSPATGRETEET